MKTTIYIMHHAAEQLDLWLECLPTEDIELVYIAPEQDIVKLLEQTPDSDLPSLILVEMSIQYSSSNLLQASRVGRWCKENQSSVKTIFLTTRPESELSKLEQRWAEKQGALCILPILNQENSQAQIRQIYGYLDLDLPNIPTFLSAKPAEKTAEPITKSTTKSTTGLDYNKLLAKRKDFAIAMNQLKEIIQYQKDGIDSYPSCREIYTHLKNLDASIQYYIEAITIDAQRHKLQSLGDKFSRISRTASKSELHPVDLNNSRRSVLLDFMPE